MHLQARAAKTKAIQKLQQGDDDESIDQCPPPLLQRISTGRGNLHMSSASSSSAIGLDHSKEEEAAESLSVDKYVVGEVLSDEDLTSDNEESDSDLGSDNETLSSEGVFELDASSGDNDCSDCDEPVQYSDGLKAASGRIWTRNAPTSTGRQHQANIMRNNEFRLRVNHLPEHNNERAFLLLFLDHFLTESIRYTNLHGKRMVRQWNSKNGNNKRKWALVDADEMEAFIGLHILAGAFKAQYRSTEELWSERDGQPVFRATMSRERFCSIKSALRFDDPLRRDKEDPLAPIRHVFEIFTMKLHQYVESGPHLCVDEQLVEFHGQVKFRQYIPSKPGKFGIKIFWVTDAETSYCLNGLVYIGKNPCQRRPRNRQLMCRRRLSYIYLCHFREKAEM